MYDNITPSSVEITFLCYGLFMVLASILIVFQNIEFAFFVENVIVSSSIFHLFISSKYLLLLVIFDCLYLKRRNQENYILFILQVFFLYIKSYIVHKK